MNIYRRYFRAANGKMTDAIKAAQELNAAAHNQYLKLLKEVGATEKYYHHGRKLVGMIFTETPDRHLFKKARNGWMPKRNTKEAKALAARFAAVETADPQSALQVVGLSEHPTIFNGGRCYMPTLIIIPDDEPTAYVSVPWYDEDPAKVTNYKSDKAAGKHFSSNMEAILWEPTADMKEIKQWEMDRHICEWNEANVTAQQEGD